MAKCTFEQFQAMYPDDAACLAKLMEVNYGGTEITCPGCGVDTKFHPLSNRRAYVCQHCGHHVYPAAGTIFHKSPTNLTKWFFTMYLMTSTRHGVAAQRNRAANRCYLQVRMAHVSRIAQAHGIGRL